MSSQVEALRSNNLAYLDLQTILGQNRGLYDIMEDVLASFRNAPEVEIIDTFALSEEWFSELMDSKLQALQNDESGAIDVMEGFDKKVQNTMPGHRRYPESLFGHIHRKAEQYVDNALAQRSDWKYHHFGSVVLTDARFENEREALIASAGQHAASQWQQLKDGTGLDLKFSFPDPPNDSATQRTIYEALSKEKSVQKAAEEKFWASIAELEAQNESDFALFWIERVDSRVHSYNDGLTSIEDQKLRDQLSELFATYIQKDLVPDAISKARSQGLIASRKTRKNVQKLEATLAASKSDVSTILSTVDKFTKKQAVEPISQSSLEIIKQTMLQDMLRRMAKQQKSSDGPVLFLTLVVVLFAKHHPGIVYATGKYAPKLLKQLKGNLEPEEYEQLDKWKEAAKAGTLGKEDREEMRRMAGA